MRRLLILVGVTLLVGLGSYALTRQFWPASLADEDQIGWLTREFDLTPAQARAVAKLHDDYVPRCSDHCARIAAARDKLAADPANPMAQAEVARLERLCQQATLAHVREVAACMDRRQSERFLALVEPRILHHDHQAAFGLK